MENRGRSSELLQDRQLELFRRVIQEEHGTRTHRSVADEVGKLDNSLREAFSQQFSTVLKEITNRDDTARELEGKLEAQRQSVRQEADAQLRKQAAESEAAAKASVEAVQAEATAAVTECERKATLEREHLTQVRTCRWLQCVSHSHASNSSYLYLPCSVLCPQSATLAFVVSNTNTVLHVRYQPHRVGKTCMVIN